MSDSDIRYQITCLLLHLARQYPQLRVGQIVSNAVAKQSDKMDVFYAPDVMLLAGLRQMIKESR